jgi:hypothetical protein
VIKRIFDVSENLAVERPLFIDFAPEKASRNEVTKTSPPKVSIETNVSMILVSHVNWHELRIYLKYDFQA